MTQEIQQSPDLVPKLNQTGCYSKHEDECFPVVVSCKGSQEQRWVLALPVATVMVVNNAITKGADVSAATHASPQSFTYSLEQAVPQVYVGGTGNMTLWLKGCGRYDRKSTESSNLAVHPSANAPPDLHSRLPMVGNWERTKAIRQVEIAPSASEVCRSGVVTILDRSLCVQETCL